MCIEAQINWMFFYSRFNKTRTVLFHAIESMIVYYSRKIQRLFVPKFYHDRNKRNFLKNLKYIGEYDKFDRKIFSEFRDLLGKNIRVTKYGSDKELPPDIFSLGSVPILRRDAKTFTF